MSKNKNLKPITTTARARELGKIGGKSKSTRKSMAASIRRRKYCNGTCRIYWSCPFMAISQKPKSEKGFGGMCGLKKMPVKARSRVTDILTRGSLGLVDEMKRVLLDMGMETDTTRNLKGKAIYYDKIKDLHDMMFGKKIRQEVSGELKTGLTPDDFKRAYEEIYGKERKNKKKS